MPKMVCVECNAGLKVRDNDVYCFEMYQDDKEIYKVWCCDSWYCPVCGSVVLAGFANNPIVENWHKDFAERVEKIKASAAEGKCRIVYEYEKAGKTRE